MPKIVETPDEIKARVAEKCRRDADAFRRRGDFRRARIAEGQAQVLNGEVEAHPFLHEVRHGIS